MTTTVSLRCRSCTSEIKEVRLCLECNTAHGISLPSNRGHEKIECTNPWHAELGTLPTKRGFETYRTGYYQGYPCLCANSCPIPCKGDCGCEACGDAYGDFLSSDYYWS